MIGNWYRNRTTLDSKPYVALVGQILELKLRYAQYTCIIIQSLTLWVLKKNKCVWAHVWKMSNYAEDEQSHSIFSSQLLYVYIDFYILSEPRKKTQISLYIVITEKCYLFLKNMAYSFILVVKNVLCLLLDGIRSVSF